MILKWAFRIELYILVITDYYSMQSRYNFVIQAVKQRKQWLFIRTTYHYNFCIKIFHYRYSVIKF